MGIVYKKYNVFYALLQISLHLNLLSAILKEVETQLTMIALQMRGGFFFE